MEATQVPWWRKALNFALNGIRSGFGLFSREQKDNAEIEPETAAGREEIREEDIELTEHSPEQESIVEVAELSEAVAVPDAAAHAAQADASVSPEIAGQSEPEPEAQFDEQAIPESEEVTGETAPVPAAEPEVEAETAPECPAEVVETQEALEPAPEPETPIQEAEAVEQPIEVAEPVAESNVTEFAPEAEAAAEEADLVSAAEPAFEVESENQEPQETVEPSEEAEAAKPEASVENTPEVEAIVIAEEAPAPDAIAESTFADEQAAAAAAEEEEEENTPLPEPEPVAEIEYLSADEEVPAVEVAPLVEPVMEAEASEVLIVAKEPAEAAVPIEAEHKPEVEPQVESAPSAIEVVHEQVTEPQETVENDSVDEVTPQAESAMSEELTPGSASPVSNETAEQVTHAADEADEAIEEPIIEAPDQISEETTEQAIEPDSGPNEQSIAQETQQAQEIDQAIEQPMELNHPNPEPSADTEVTAEAVAPDVTAEPEAAAEASANAPFAASDTEPSKESSEDAEAPSIEPVAAHPSKPFIKLEAREGDANASPFSVIVSQVYDGPLDLLLDLIRKQDIDIYDIPIAHITAQFLAYVNQLKASDVDVAGEFIYTASLLIHIKSKMLLPRAPSGPAEAAEDPRRELVERLLEHERFKNAAQMLQQKQMLEAATWTNPGVRDFKEDVGAEPEIEADTVDLVRVFREILDRARNRPVLNVQEDSVTVGQMIQFLSRRLTMEDKPVALRKLLSHTRSERALIAMFLALLELVRLQAILLRQDRAFSEIFIKKHTDFESVMNQGLARDDWQ